MIRLSQEQKEGDSRGACLRRLFAGSKSRLVIFRVSSRVESSSALRAHDQRLANELDELRQKLGQRSAARRRLELPDKIEVLLPSLCPKEFAKAFYARAVESSSALPPLKIEQILEWADSHYHRNGVWPGQRSGIVAEAPHETWRGIEGALKLGGRGLTRGSSLAKLLAEHRGVWYARHRILTEKRILMWADAHHDATGGWPKRQSGRLIGEPHETWLQLDMKLQERRSRPLRWNNSCETSVARARRAHCVRSAAVDRGRHTYVGRLTFHKNR